MQVSPAGAIAHVLWFEIKNHAKNIHLGEFVVMPNHVHGILILDGKTSNGGDVGTMPAGTMPAGTTPALSLQPNDNGLTVGTGHALSLPNALSRPYALSLPTGQQRFQNQGKNTISSIVGSYKSAVTKYCNRLGLQLAWQSRFHDHIIQNDESYQRISEYIISNPLNWSEDQFFK